MDFNQLIIDIMVVFMAVAIIDKCFGSRFGLGNEIDEALSTIGPMCIPMAGMILIAPVIGIYLSPIISPIFRFMGADPAMFATSILACDMGGYPLAYAIADTPEAAQFAGCILGCSLGGAVSFIIPVGIALIKHEYHSNFAIGVLAGIITIPIGLFVGGLTAGYSIIMILRNTFPILLLSLGIALCLWKIPSVSIAAFKIFGRIVAAVAAISFAIGVAQELTHFVVLPGMMSVLDGIRIVGSVAIVLCGAYPMLYLINKLYGKSIDKMGRFLGIDKMAVSGIFGGFANIMPVLGSGNRMSPAGVVVSLAFAVSGSCVFGDHLGYIASVDKSMILPMICSKLVGSFFAVVLAVYICQKKNIGIE